MWGGGGTLIKWDSPIEMGPEEKLYRYISGFSAQFSVAILVTSDEKLDGGARNKISTHFKLQKMYANSYLVFTCDWISLVLSLSLK